MIKILVVSDDGVSTGYGRISMETNRRLVKRGYHVMAASLGYDGLLPASYDGEPLPYHVASLQGKPNWPDLVVQLVGAYQPDIIHVIQDAPYAVTVKAGPYDWSKYGFMVTTPVDGSPIYPAWVELGKKADALMTISQFGVNTWRKAGVGAQLTRPGVALNTFYPLNNDKRAEIRKQLGIEQDAFVVGTMAQNQGRKAISLMLKAFMEFAQDKPNARYLMDMDEQSPAGWDIPALCIQNNWDVSKIIFRSECNRKGITELRERYNMLDVHMVISHREGFGLPLPESQACGVVAMALDYTSGTEICGNGYGVLVKPLDFSVPGTWGGAEDYFPDMKDFVAKLQWLHDNPSERAAIAARGMAEARSHTWDQAVDVVQANIEKVLERRKKLTAQAPVAFPQAPQTAIMNSSEPLPQSVDGLALVEA